MNQWNQNCYSKKKVRGLGRRLRTFSKYLNEQIDSLPVQNNKDPNYEGLSVKDYKPIDAEYEYENCDEIWFIGRLS